MRLTTKIIVGIILSIFSISLLLIVGLSFAGRKYMNRSNVFIIDLPQDKETGIDLAPFRTVIIDEIPNNSEKYNLFVGNNCTLYIDSIPEKNNPERLFIPESLKDFISVETSEDTLTVKLNIPGLYEKYNSNEYKHYSVSGVNFHFIISEIDVINKLRELSVSVKNIETDTIKIDSYGDVYIDSCKASVIDPAVKTNYKKLTIKDCEVRKINLDLDHGNHWNVENCIIEEENLTGSKTHNIIHHRNEPGKINWLPKNKDANLNITIQGDTTQILIAGNL